MTNHQFDTAYLDESGDNGAKGSKYLIMALWCVSENKRISKIIRDTKQQLLRKSIGAKWLAKKGGEIKYSNFPDKRLLKKMLGELSELESSIYYVALEKKGKNVDNSEKELILRELFWHKIFFGNMPKKIIADKQYFKNRKVAYCLLKELTLTEKEIKTKKYLLKLVEKEEYEKLKRDEWEHIIKIEHHNSQLNEHLQALDILTGAIFYFYENKDPILIDIIRKGNIRIKEYSMD